MLYLVRHAEDVAAAERRFADEGLTERGREQARALGERLAGTAFDVCLCSPLQRAEETARLLLEARPSSSLPSLSVDANLAEGSHGALDGLAYEEAARRHPEAFASGRSMVARLAATGHTAPGGESRDDFQARAESAAKRIEAERRAGSERLLVVSHGGLLNALIHVLLGFEARDDVPFGFDHCGVVRVLRYAEAPDFGPFEMLRFGTV